MALRDIRFKINAVTKTKQITKAMYMVASAKLRSAQQRSESFRPYAAKFREMLVSLSQGTDGTAHALLEKRENISTSCILLVTTDRGLCGAFNANLIATARNLAANKKAEGKNVKFICVGRKGRDAIRRHGFEIIYSDVDVMGSFDFSLAMELGREVIKGFLGGAFDEINIVYGRFKSLLYQIPTILPLLPISAQEAAAEEEKDAKEALTQEHGGPRPQFLYEPSADALLSSLLPRYVNVQINRALLDTSASEHAARMRSMDNATRNCDDLVKSLTLMYNKARQYAITSELIDIVGGTEALK